MTDKELLQQALATLCVSSEPKSGYRRNELHLTPKLHIELYQETIEAIKARLAQPEKEWVGLTTEEVKDILKLSKDAHKATKRIEAKLKEKNAA